MNKFVFLFGASLVLATTAHAEGFYVAGSIGFGDATLRSDVQVDYSDDKLFLAKAIGGYRVNKFFAVEGTIIGATNDEWDDWYDWDKCYCGFDGEADVSFGALTGTLIGIVPVKENFELFARVGGYVGESELGDDFYYGTNYRDEDESGLVWGAGAFINFGRRKEFTIRVEYEEFDTDALEDFWAISGGFQYNF